jgi:hypothetical protein
MLRQIYHALPLSAEARKWFNNKTPLAWKRQAHLRKFGVINELYCWRLDRNINTIAPIQNFFSNIFPTLNTATEGCLWMYDKDGKEIAQHNFLLPHFGIHVVNINNFVDNNEDYGTFMWSIKMPDSVAQNQDVRKNHIYFTDRGYICYEKSGSQPCFTHGVDRYLVFQKQEMESSTFFYKKSKKDRSWLPEFPLSVDMQEELDIILLNRSSSLQNFTITVYQNGGHEVFHSIKSVPARGVGICTLDAEILTALNGSEGYFLIEGLATQWGRPTIMRHFNCGSLSVMHC